MQQFNFNKFKPFSECNFDLNYINNIEDLCRFVVTYYTRDTCGDKYEQFVENWKSYQSMITQSIKLNNLDALECLWQGIYFHDRANPDFETDVYTAAEFSTLQTFKYVLYGYMNYHSLNPKENLKHSKLKELASVNSDKDVLRLIESLYFIVRDDELDIIPENCEEEYSSEEEWEKNTRILCKKYYDWIENFD